MTCGRFESAQSALLYSTPLYVTTRRLRDSSRCDNDVLPTASEQVRPLKIVIPELWAIISRYSTPLTQTHSQTVFYKRTNMHHTSPNVGRLLSTELITP